MKHSSLMLLATFLFSGICMGQNPIIQINKPATTSPVRVENKNIGLNFITTDSLTYTEFLHCNKITVKHSNIDQINFYSLTYFIPNKITGEKTDVTVQSQYNDKIATGVYSKNCLVRSPKNFD